MKVGDIASAVRAFSGEDAAALAELGGPGAADGFTPEPLVGALISRLLGVELPGPGANYLKQETQFLRRAPLGEPLTAEVRITRLRPEKRLVDLETTCTDTSGRVICHGRALIYAEDVPDAFD